MSATCAFCSVPVKPQDRGVYERVTAWQTRGAGESRKGGSDLVLREATGEHACFTCVSRLKMGVPIQQESLAL